MLIYPLFITDNEDEETLIPSLPGQYRFVATYPESRRVRSGKKES